MRNKKIKILLFWLLVLGSVSSNYGQDGTNIKQIDSLALKMFIDANNKDFDAIIDMTHPKVFDIISKDEMKSVIKSMFEGNEEFSIEIPNEIPDYKLSDVFRGNENNLEYAFVTYDMKMKMTFNNQEFDDDAKEMMVPMMKAQGMEVEFVSNNSMKVLMKDRVTILLKEDATKNKWVMINYDPNSPLTYQVLPSNLLEKAKEYRQNLLLRSKKKSEN